MPAQILAHAATRLAAYKRPKQVFFVPCPAAERQRQAALRAGARASLIPAARRCMTFSPACAWSRRPRSSPAPSCGLHLAQLGAEVIRIDPIGGGPDFHRWPLTPEGASLYWEGLNKGKKSIAIDLARPEGRELAQRLATAPGDGGGPLRHQLSGGGLPLPRQARGAPPRHHHAPRHGLGRRRAGGRLHGQRGGRHSADDRAPDRSASTGQSCAARLGPAGRSLRRLGPARGRAGAAATGQGRRDPAAARRHRAATLGQLGQIAEVAHSPVPTGRGSATICSAPSAAISSPATASG